MSRPGLFAALCIAAGAFACSWDHPTWPKSPKSDTPLFRIVTHSEYGAGYIDRTGKVIIPPQYRATDNKGGDFFDGLAKVSTRTGNFYIDAKGNRRPASENDRDYAEGLAVSGTRNMPWKYGYRNTKGVLVIPRQFDDAHRFQEGLALVRVRDHYGYIDRAGKMVIAPQYLWAQSFSEGLAWVIESGPCTVFLGGDDGGCGGDLRLPWHKDGKFHQDRTQPFKPCAYAAIDNTGRVVFRTHFPAAAEFREGLAAVGANDRYGYIDRQGRTVIPLRYVSAGPFSEGLASVHADQPDVPASFIDRTGKVVIRPQYMVATPFSEGLAAVADQNLNYTFIDKTGKQAIPGTFDGASPFVMGLAHVRTGDSYKTSKHSWIDKTGRAVFTYSSRDDSAKPR